MSQTDKVAQMVKIFKAKKTEKSCEEPAGTLRKEGNNLLVATADKWLAITEMQLAGKKRMPTDQLLLGLRDIEQHRFG